MRRKNKFLILLLVLVLLAVAPLQVFAAPALRADGHISYAAYANQSYKVNAYTDGTPVHSTDLRMWASTGHSTQDWIHDVPWLYPSFNLYALKSVANINVTIGWYNGQARLVNYNLGDPTNQGIHLAVEGAMPDGRLVRGIVLYHHLRALTANGYSNGADITWNSPNGAQSQLWVTTY